MPKCGKTFWILAGSSTVAASTYPELTLHSGPSFVDPPSGPSMAPPSGPTVDPSNGPSLASPSGPSVAFPTGLDKTVPPHTGSNHHIDTTFTMNIVQETTIVSSLQLEMQ